MPTLSGWMHVYPVKEPTAKSTIDCLEQSFCINGLPDTLVSDNGPAFVAEDFRSIASRREICVSEVGAVSSGFEWSGRKKCPVVQGGHEESHGRFNFYKIETVPVPVQDKSPCHHRRDSSRIAAWSQAKVAVELGPSRFGTASTEEAVEPQRRSRQEGNISGIHGRGRSVHQKFQAWSFLGTVSCGGSLGAQFVCM